MLKALYYCHNIAKVIHRDIKPDNIMINHNNEAVLIDFGVSALVEGDDVMEHNMGSLMFFAPEMFQKGSDKKVIVHGVLTDLWALGVTFFYLICGHYPFLASNVFDLKDKVLE
jgi:serine/threonine protein kinase